MAGSQNDFDLNELRDPIQRAHQIERRHSLFQRDAKGEEHFSWRQANERYGRYLISPLWGVYQDRKRYMRVLKAMGRSLDQAASMMGAETNEAWHGVIAALLPMLGQMAAAVGVGAVVGGALGAVAGLGVGDEITVPEGALLGARLALWVTGMLGIAELVGHAITKLDSFARLATEAVEIAWWAGDDPKVDVDRDLTSASRLFAFSIAELWMALLDALIVWVLHRAGEIASDSAGKITANAAVKQAIGEMRGKTKKLGPGFGEWFEKNFPAIQKLVADRKAQLQEIEGDRGGDAGSAGTSGAGKSSGANQATSPRAAEEPTVLKNRRDGLKREAQTEAELKQQYPDASVQREQYLRTSDGKIAKDPLTGEGRRVDHVVVEDGQVVDSVETTSMTSDKADQIAKENRIRAAGGTYIRDRDTGDLLDMSNVPTRLERKP